MKSKVASGPNIVSCIIFITPSLVGIPSAMISVLRRSRTAVARYSTRSMADTPMEGSAFQQTNTYSGCAAKCCQPLLLAGLHMDLTRKVHCMDASGNPDSLSTEPSDVEIASSLSWVPGPTSSKRQWFSVKTRPRSHFVCRRSYFQCAILITITLDRFFKPSDKIRLA